MPVCPTAPPVVVRPVAPGDEEALLALMDRLDEDDQYHRWFSGGIDLRRAAHDAASRTGVLAIAGSDVIGHGLLAEGFDRSGEVAFEVDPLWRRHGIATMLLRRLIAEARARGLRRVTADVLCENRDMLAVFHEVADFASTREGAAVHLSLALSA